MALLESWLFVRMSTVFARFFYSLLHSNLNIMIIAQGKPRHFVIEQDALISDLI